jgi:hypothetical protein
MTDTKYTVSHYRYLALLRLKAQAWTGTSYLPLGAVAGAIERGRG